MGEGVLLWKLGTKCLSCFCEYTAMDEAFLEDVVKSIVIPQLHYNAGIHFPFMLFLILESVKTISLKTQNKVKTQRKLEVKTKYSAYMS